MDRPIDKRVHRSRHWRRLGAAALALGGLIAAATGLPGLLRPQVERQQLRTARVEPGPIEATLTASGTVVPELEQVVSSPVDARVLRIRKRPGDVLEKGDAILDLDVSSARLEVDRLAQQLALKLNQQSKTRLDLAASLQDLQGQRRVKALELGAQRARSSRDRDLHEKGYLSRDELDQSELTAARVAVELEKIDAAIEHARRSNTAQVQGLALERATVEREREQAQRLLELATTKADRKAVLLWTVREEGATVKKGELLARLADLSKFRVDATVSDLHAQRLHVGQSVLVQVGEARAQQDDRLPGTIAQIEPAIRDGAVTFSVALAQPSSQLLRANMRVDVMVVVGRKEHTLRVPRGPFAEGEGQREVFVVHGERVVRTPAQFGVASATHLEVLRGLAPGDEVVISDMSAYLHRGVLNLR
jgi:HlyD family secretion protein